MPAALTIVGLGEALFDIFPDKQVLGGAPLNVAVHAHQLAAALPGGAGRGVVVSRVGQDDLGRRLTEDLTRRGMTIEFVQTDPDKATGKVYVGVDVSGQPTYDIAKDAAWDKLQFDPDMEHLAQHCEAVCFGTLAQRDGQSRNTIQRFLPAAARAVRLFDVNLRQRYYDQRTLQRSCEMATAVKLNVEELAVVSRVLNLAPPELEAVAGEANVDRQARTLLKRFKLTLVALTRAERGTVLYTPPSTSSGQAAPGMTAGGAGAAEREGGRYEQAPVSYPMAVGADAVGAGDACSAALLVGLLLRWPLERTLTLANHVGAYVASQPGATPALPESILALVRG